jgi:hypothetical protein
MKTKHGSPEIIHLVITVVYNLEIERSAYPDESSYADICNYERENFPANQGIFTPSEIKAEIRKGEYAMEPSKIKNLMVQP